MGVPPSGRLTSLSRVVPGGPGSPCNNSVLGQPTGVRIAVGFDSRLFFSGLFFHFSCSGEGKYSLLTNDRLHMSNYIVFIHQSDIEDKNIQS